MKKGVQQLVGIDPADLISFSSEIPEASMNQLRAELCRIPRKPHPSGMVQLMSKVEMQSKYQIASPNMADAVMMSMRQVNTAIYDDFDLSYSTPDHYFE